MCAFWICIYVRMYVECICMYVCMYVCHKHTTATTHTCMHSSNAKWLACQYAHVHTHTNAHTRAQVLAQSGGLAVMLGHHADDIIENVISNSKCVLLQHAYVAHVIGIHEQIGCWASCASFECATTLKQDCHVYLRWCFDHRQMMLWPSTDDALTIDRWCFDHRPMMLCT